MKQLHLFIFLFLLTLIVVAQNDPAASARIGKQIQAIYKSTDWNDPAAAKKANEEIDKLSKQLTGSTSMPFQIPPQSAKPGAKPANVGYQSKTAPTKENVVAIADRFFKRSYKNLDAVSKSEFEKDFKAAEKEKFSFTAVRKLNNVGGVLLTFGNDHNIACVYLAAAVKAFPTDTLAINNFGGYLRTIDSTKVSIPVLLYANKLFSKSPIILTQLGNSYFELDDFAKAETYYKEALKVNPDFGQAHTSLCDLYISQGRIKEAITELFAGVKNNGATFAQASSSFAQIQQQNASTTDADDFESKEEFWGEVKKQTGTPGGASKPGSDVGKVKMPNFPDCRKVEDWTLGGGYLSAVNRYNQFVENTKAFALKFEVVQKEQPNLPPNAIRRDYDQQCFMIDGISTMFENYTKIEEEKYKKNIEQITQRVFDEFDNYLKYFEIHNETQTACINSCYQKGDLCQQNCMREFCLKMCEKVNKFNDVLRIAYNNYRVAFSDLVNKQTKNLDDYYAFTQPWAEKIDSPYWSRIYEYERKRVALEIVGSCFSNYPQNFLPPTSAGCETDCSIYFEPYVDNTPADNRDDPEANNCPPDTKTEIPLLMCSIKYDCESYELGCSAGVAASMKRNHKKGTTTMFVGAGLSADLGALKAGAKFGAEFTVGDDNSVDGGLKVGISSKPKFSIHGVSGVEETMTITVLGGVKTQTTTLLSPLAR